MLTWTTRGLILLFYSSLIYAVSSLREPPSSRVSVYFYIVCFYSLFLSAVLMKYLGRDRRSATDKGQKQVLGMVQDEAEEHLVLEREMVDSEGHTPLSDLSSDIAPEEC